MKKKILCLIFSMLFLLSAFVFPSAAGSFGTEDINETDVMQDLDRMKFNFGNYPMNREADYCQLIRFLEYGYDYNGRDDDYELFLYVYNPSGRELVLDSLNQVTMSVRSSTDTALVDYTKYKLSLLSASSQEGYENVFYKFRVILPSSFMNKPEQERRVYAISEIELHWTGQAKATAINVSGRYTCTGYIPYHGRNTSDAANTLSTSVTDLFTLDLQLNGTAWKTKSSDRGQGYQYEIFSVYFSVPNQVIKKYGDTEDPTKGLYQIDGVYDEYRVNGLLTDNSDCYEWLLQHVGFYDFSNPPVAFLSRVPSGKYFAYNAESFPEYETLKRYWHIAEKYCTVFQDVDGMSCGEFAVALSTFQNRYGTYFLNTVETGSLAVPGKEYTVSKEHGDLNSQISSYSSNHSWFGSLLAGGLDWYDKSESYGQCLPIVTVPWDEVFFAKTDDAISEALFIDKGDVSHLRNFTNEAYLKDETTYLMRFAVRDYYCDKAELYEVDNLYTGGLFDRKFMFSDNYYYQKTVFNNFDVLSLTYEDVYFEKTIVPVVVAPIDIFGNLSIPSTGGVFGNFLFGIEHDAGEALDWLGQFRWWVILLGALLAFAFLTWIFKKLGLSLGKLLGGIGKGIGSIFRGVGKAVSGIFSLSDRRQKKKAAKNDERRKDNEDRRKENADKRAQEDFDLKHSKNEKKEESHEKKD